jgi:transposase
VRGDGVHPVGHRLQGRLHRCGPFLLERRRHASGSGAIHHATAGVRTASHGGPIGHGRAAGWCYRSGQRWARCASTSG